MKKNGLLKIRDIGRPRKGLPGMRNKVPQTRDISYYTGRVATLYTTHVLAGTFRLLGFSHEHVRLTGPSEWSSRLGIPEAHSTLSLAQTTQMLVVNDLGTNPT